MRAALINLIVLRCWHSPSRQATARFRPMVSHSHSYLWSRRCTDRRRKNVVLILKRRGEYWVQGGFDGTLL
jgi:hypothetical protein